MSAEDETAKMATEEFVAEYSEEHKIQPYSGTPKKDGVASAGDASSGFACGDHVHPTDTSRMAANATGANIAVSGSDPTKISVALSGKADSATTYTKAEVDAIVAAVKTGSRQTVASLNDVTDPKPLVIYMVAKQSAQTKNAYDEYIWTAAGAWEKIGDTEIDLSGYVPKETGKGLSTNDYTTADKTKLDGIEANAKANVIETVKVNGTELTPEDKAVDITYDNAVTKDSSNGVKSSGIWSAIWGALAALPTGFTSLYDWCVSQLAPKAARTELFPAWAANTAYTTYSLVIHENAVYRCTDAHTSGAEWDSTKWAVASGAEVLAMIRDYLALSNKPQINGVELYGNKTAADLWLATKADATLTERGPNKDGFSAWEWQGTPPTYDGEAVVLRLEPYPFPPDDTGRCWVAYTESGVQCGPNGDPNARDDDNTRTEVTVEIGGGISYPTATRTALQGYQLGSQSDKQVASEAEAEALRTGKQDALSAQQLANIAAVSDALAFDATHSYAAGDPVVYNGTLYTFTATHTGAWTGSDVSAVDIIARLAGKLDKSGGTMTGPLEMGEQQLVFGNRYCIVQFGNSLAILDLDNAINTRIPFSPTGVGTLALTADIPYSLADPTVIDTASSEEVEGETVYFGAATLADRTANIVQVTAATALDELRITFPAATSGKVRDFGLRVEIGTGSAALTAPALVPIAPTGETIKIENNAKEIPALADGTATAKGVTLLYFSENAPGVFVVKGEQVEEVA